LHCMFTCDWPILYKFEHKRAIQGKLDKHNKSSTRILSGEGLGCMPKLESLLKQVLTMQVFDILNIVRQCTALGPCAQLLRAESQRDCRRGDSLNL